MHRTMIGLAAALVLALAPVASFSAEPATAGDSGALSAAEVLPVCDRALSAALDGHDARAVVDEAVKGQSEDRKQAVIAICGVYLAGALSMIRRAAEAPKVPAGASVTI